VIQNRTALAGTPARALALDCIEAGIDAAHPATVIPETISLDGEALRVAGEAYDLAAYDELVVLGGGNAAGQVAVALERVLGDQLSGGIVVTDDPAETERTDVRAGGHPVPSERNVDATRDILARAREFDDRTLVLAVVTGGGSALLAAPAVSLDALRETTDALLRSGASIHEINAVRKHLSRTKGGGLAAACAPATVVTLVFSDVVGDDLDTIASGPTVPDGSTLADARRVLADYDIEPPVEVEDRLDDPGAETPSAAFDHVSTHVLASARTALGAARTTAERAGYDTHIYSDSVTGEARDAAADHVELARRVRDTGDPVSPPAVVLSAGECTVTVTGDGEGGPNQEFALAAAVERVPGVLATVDTDGIDGNADAAGAIVDSGTVDDEPAARAALDANDVHDYLEERDALIRTGATGTNVNDLRALVLD